MKKFSLSSSFFIVLFTVSFATAAYAEITVTGDKPIYPAVFQAIQNGQKSVWSEIKIANITDPNTVVINNVRTGDLLNIADFTLQISVENNVVKYQFLNIKTRTQLSKTWTDRSEFAAKNAVEKSFTDFFDAEIPKVMGNDTLYAQAKQAADRNSWAPRAAAPAAAQAPAPTERPIWQFGQYTNEWGDRTNNYFMRFNGNIIGTFTNSAASNRNLAVTEITFSKLQGLNFQLYEYGRDAVLLVGSEKVSIIMKYDNKEKTVPGKAASPKTVVLDFSDDLVNILSLEQDVLFRVTISDVYGLSRYYQFVFKPVNFKKAYDELKAMEANPDKK